MLNLLLDFEEMGRLLRDRLQALAGRSEDGADEALLDAFLLAAGMNQVLEDYLQRDVGSLGRAAPHLPQVLGARAGPLGARAAVDISEAGGAIRSRLSRVRSVVARQEELAGLVGRLAEGVARNELPDAEMLQRGRDAVSDLLEAPRRRCARASCGSPSASAASISGRRTAVGLRRWWRAVSRPATGRCSSSACAPPAAISRLSARRS
jgi:hypothetical protein